MTDLMTGHMHQNKLTQLNTLLYNSPPPPPQIPVVRFPSVGLPWF